MALNFTNTGVVTGQPVEASQISQSFDAFTGVNAYNINLSGSLSVTGSISSSLGFEGDLTGEASTSVSSSFAVSSSLAVRSTQLEFTNIAGTLTSEVFLKGTAVFESGVATVTDFSPQLEGKTLGTDCFVLTTYMGTSINGSPIGVTLNESGHLVFNEKGEQSEEFMFMVFFT